MYTSSTVSYYCQLGFRFTCHLRTIKCCSVVFGVTLKLLAINTSSLSPVKNKLRRLPATATTCYGPSQLSVLHLAVEPFTARDGARYWLRIACPTCIRRPGGFLLKICLFVLTEFTNVTDRQTDRRTDGHRMTAALA